MISGSMKSLKIFVIMGLMLLFGGTCFAQQQEEFQKDSIWGLFADTTATDVVLHFYFSEAPYVFDEICFLQFSVCGDNKFLNYFSIELDTKHTPIEKTPLSSKYKTVELTYAERKDAGYVEVEMKIDRAALDHAARGWDAISISVNSSQYSDFVFPLKPTSLLDIKSGNESDCEHRYFSMSGHQLNEPPHVGYYIDCLFSRDNQVVDCKKCLSR